MAKLQILNYNGFQVLNSSELGIYPIFQNHIRWRTNQKLCTNICVTGEPGIGKSYIAIDIARVFEGLYRSKTTHELKERFKVKQIVFTHSDYMDLLINLKLGKSIVFDEPSYAMGKRDWFKDLQKVLVHTLESQRFLVHPLFIPIINMSLLDKTIRNYLIQFQIHVVGRGHGLVYRLKPSQATEKVYREFMCDLYYHQFDRNRCSRDSCLGCPQLAPEDPEKQCKIFRAQYERKKRSTQFERYEQAKDEALQKEAKELTEKQIEEMALQYISEIVDENTGKVSVPKLRVILRKKCNVRLSTWKAYQIKGNLEAQYPEKFED